MVKTFPPGTVSRRAMVAGAAGTVGLAAARTGSTAQGTPATDGLDTQRVMMVSANLCGGAQLKTTHLDELLALMTGESDAASSLEELARVTEFTDAAMKELSPEAQALAANMLQFWFLGRWNGEPIPNRSGVFFDLACWQALPYSTQPSTCKSFGYWAVEIEL